MSTACTYQPLKCNGLGACWYDFYVGELFTSKEFDQEGADAANGVDGIQAYYFGARYYDPGLGIWYGTDPKDQFHNSYSYTGGNPVNLVDPDGQWVGALISAASWYVSNAIGAGSWNPGEWDWSDPELLVGTASMAFGVGMELRNHFHSPSLSERGLGVKQPQEGILGTQTWQPKDAMSAGEAVGALNPYSTEESFRGIPKYLLPMKTYLTQTVHWPTVRQGALDLGYSALLGGFAATLLCTPEPTTKVAGGMLGVAAFSAAGIGVTNVTAGLLGGKGPNVPAPFDLMTPGFPTNSVRTASDPFWQLMP